MHMKHETRGKGIFVMWVDIRRRWSAGGKAGGEVGRAGRRRARRFSMILSSPGMEATPETCRATRGQVRIDTRSSTTAALAEADS